MTDSLPVLHPDRIERALKWLDGDPKTRDFQDATEVYETAIASLKTMQRFQRTLKLTGDVVDKATALKDIFSSLKKLTQRK